jgi:hypothetical protein
MQTNETSTKFPDVSSKSSKGTLKTTMRQTQIHINHSIFKHILHSQEANILAECQHAVHRSAAPKKQ